MLSKLVVRTLPLVPTPVMRRLSRRYIAGETLDSALEKLSALEAGGFSGILDILGEEVTTEEVARRVARDYQAAADAAKKADVDCYVSIKPTHVGLSQSEDLCFELYSEIARHCAKLDLFMRVEMEDHTTTDATLRVFERLRAEFTNIGCVLQTRLFRTPADVDAFVEGPPLDVRIVKGIYLEPAEIAYTEPDPIREAFHDITEKLLKRGARVSLATHDEALGGRLAMLIKKHRIGTDRYEFQTLLGVREGLASRWRDAGHPVRIYVPYGPDWRAYSTRRLRKNPEIMSHLIRNLFRKD